MSCTPVGSLAPYTPAHDPDRGCPHCGTGHTCWICRVPLRQVRAVNPDDWVYVDEAGRPCGATPCPPLHPQIAEDMRQLARDGKITAEQAERYIASHTGWGVPIVVTSHMHAPRHSDCPKRRPYPVPFCCDEPMRSGPGVWACRVTNQRFATEAEEVSA